MPQRNFLFFVLPTSLLNQRPPGAPQGHLLRGTPSFAVRFLPTALLYRRSPTAPSFVARRKMGEKGVPRGCGPLNPRSNVLGHSDVLCANRFATVHLTRLSRLRCREANTLGVRDAYPLASACCALTGTRSVTGGSALGVRCQGHGNAYDLLRSLRTSDRRHWCGNPYSPLVRTSVVA